MSEKGKHRPRSWLSEQILNVFDQGGIEPLLEEGFELVKKGRVLDFSVHRGTMSAKVQGERYQPYLAEIAIVPFSDEQWQAIFEKLSGQALYYAKLLTSELPEEIENVFQELGLELFPQTLSALSLKCSCGKKDQLCVHFAALYFLINERFSENPFLIFALRGRTRQETITELRKLRHQTSHPSEQRGKHIFSKAAYQSSPSLEEQLADYWSCDEKIQSLSFTIRADELPGAILRQLSTIPITSREVSVEQVLEDAYDYIANRAQAFGLGLTKV